MSKGMWVQRTPEEIARWDERAGRDARFHALTIAGVIGVLIPSIAATGWFVSLRTGMVVHTNSSARFWVRLLASAIIMLPIGLYAYRRERRRELARAMQQTICTTCESMGDGNAGAVCACGGTMVALREVKWVSDGEQVGQ